MTHQPEKKGFDLFNKRKNSHRNITELNPGLFRRIQSINLLYLGSAFIQTVTGFFAVSLSVLQLIQPVWAAAFMGILGSVLTMAGLAMFYFTFKGRKSVDNMVKETIQRVIRDQN